MNRNPYAAAGSYQPTIQWNYGYTLGPSSAENGGDYSVYYEGKPAFSTEMGVSGDQGFAPPAPVKRHVKRTSANIELTSSSLPSTSSSILNQQQPQQQQHQPTSWNEIKTKKSFVSPQTISAAPKLIGPQIPDDKADEMTAALSRLHELAIHNRLVEKFDTSPNPSGGHQALLLLGIESYNGVGPTVKSAKQNAAMQALASTNYKFKQTMRVRPTSTTPTSELHEMATKKNVPVDFTFVEPFNFKFNHSMRLWSKEDMRGNYTVSLKVGGYTFFGKSDMPQQAKHNAAMQAIPVVRSFPDPNQPKVSDTRLPQPVPKLETAKDMSTVEEEVNKNPVMKVNEIAMSHGQMIDWVQVADTGTQHMKTYTWKLKLGNQYESLGSGTSKKLAKNAAAQAMLASLPEEWLAAKTVKKKAKGKGKKRKMAATIEAAPTAVVVEAKKAKKDNDFSGKPVYEVIQNANPISAVHEYCKKAKLPEPQFDCVAENVIETWQKNNHTFKKTEYTMQLVVDGKTYFQTGNTKKKAKTNVATDAWNHAGIFP